GTEGLLLLGLARLVLETKLKKRPEERQTGPWAASVRDVSLSQVVQDTEVPRDVIDRLADELLRASAPLVLVGGMATAQSNGTLSIMAANALNALLGSVGPSRGMQFIRPAPLAGGSDAVGERALVDAVARVGASRGSLFLYSSNLLH